MFPNYELYNEKADNAKNILYALFKASVKLQF